ncbi:hypothetical protein DFH07DRAFT_832911 [Mycena maculata]|uniref:MYND-type domain-containing protein n=1 Tax=Mycena maculata TaxID=230809 RepID=A0AAD7N6A4_9AGAR|nr:hypothetical protein DFH07DRAFT_832911 [Mycena maculata]
MPGSGDRSFPKHKIPKRPQQTDGTGDKAYVEAATRFCSMDQCFNHENLKKCARCNHNSVLLQHKTALDSTNSIGVPRRCASYCSVECQRKKWKQHKPLCQYNAAQLELADGEPVLQRNLRNWTVRFDATLLNACIRGLNLKYEWERLDQGALMILLEPRPHPNAGSRWRIKNGSGMFRNEAIMGILENAHLAD